MGTWVVACASCALRWPRVGQFSEYERAELESRPCPRCGAYTLGCPAPKPGAKGGRRVVKAGRRAAA